MIVISFLELLKFDPRHRRRLFVGALLLVSSVQWMCLRYKVSYIEPKLYSTMSYELEITPKWRYGFVQTYHGAHLVRTPNISLRPLQPVEHDAKFDDIWATMRTELRLIPLKAASEASLYVLLLAYVLFGAPWIAARVQTKTTKRIWYLGCLGLLWAVGWTIMAAPLLAAGYGEPIYSTWAGPGAMSYSGPYFGKTSFGNGMTISYRGLFEVVAPGISAMAIAASGLPRYLPRMSTAVYLWLVGIVFYGIVGMLWDLGVKAASPSPQSSICPRCNKFVEDPQYKRGLGRISGRCSLGHKLSMAHSFTGCFVGGVCACIGWMLVTSLFLDGLGIHGKARLVVVGVVLLPTVVAYGVTQVWRGLQYRRVPHPAFILAKSHFGVGAGILCYLAVGLIAMSWQ